MRFLRHYSPILFLAAYVVQMFAGRALHELQCGDCGSQCVAHASCSHSHGDGSNHSHIDSAPGKRAPGEKAPHDSSDCSVCQTLAQSQLNVAAFVFDVRSEAVIAHVEPQPQFLVAESPLGFLSRAPPAA